MYREISSPNRYIQGVGELENVFEYYKALGKTGAYIIMDNFIYNMYKDIIEKGFVNSEIKYKILVFGGECSEDEIYFHVDNLNKEDVVIGIGGGKTLDTAKAVAYYANKPVIIVPTVASSDAPCSKIAVIYSSTGVLDRYLILKKNPDIIVVDSEVISKAPVRLLVAGMGDALSTYYEARACRASGTKNSTYGVMALARLSRDIVLRDGIKAMEAIENKQHVEEIESIIEANIYLSGIGFESGGLAAAHALNNALTTAKECKGLLHGEVVAFTTLVQLILEDVDIKEIEYIASFMKQVGLPTNLKDMKLDKLSKEKIYEIAKIACDYYDGMKNMPFEVKADDVVSAIYKIDTLFGAS